MASSRRHQPTIRDMFQIPIVGGGRLSPDGDKVIYGLAYVDNFRDNSALYYVDGRRMLDYRRKSWRSCSESNRLTPPVEQGNRLGLRILEAPTGGYLIIGTAGGDERGWYTLLIKTDSEGRVSE